MAHLDVHRHRDAPTYQLRKTTVSLCYLFALLIVCFCPALEHQGDDNNAKPLSPWLGHSVAEALLHAAPWRGQLGSLPTLQGSALGCTMCSNFPLMLLSLTVTGSER